MDFLITLAIEIATDVATLVALSVVFFFIAEKM
jgi:hypothetical protein